MNRAQKEAVSRYLSDGLTQDTESNRQILKNAISSVGGLQC